ncbi:MAG: helix-turn-helix transcriptional regulator [Nocardioidaceae bacterium]|nr:MAG: helix-turn-helix transcriptional regulator [Nocardioidaceae bacterium]
MTTPATLGEHIAQEIARHLDRLGWDYKRLAEEAGLSWGELLRTSGDASSITFDELAAIAQALGVMPSALVPASRL